MEGLQSEFLGVRVVVFFKFEVAAKPASGPVGPAGLGVIGAALNWNGLKLSRRS